MFVREMTGPDDASEAIIENPTWEQIEEGIRRLNGQDRTLLSLSQGHEVPHMIVAGGNDGNYLAYITFDNEKFYNLINPAADKDTLVPLVCGGQEAEYPASQCVDINMALAAAKSFAEEGGVNPSLQWADLND